MSDVPDCLKCSVTLDVFRDPVVGPDGNTYERTVLEEIARRRAPDGGRPMLPASRVRFSMCEVYPNLAVAAMIDGLRHDHPELFPPPESPPPVPPLIPGSPSIPPLPIELAADDGATAMEVVDAPPAPAPAPPPPPPTALAVAIHPDRYLAPYLDVVREQLAVLSQHVRFRTMISAPDGRREIDPIREWIDERVEGRDCTALVQYAVAQLPERAMVVLITSDATTLPFDQHLVVMRVGTAASPPGQSAPVPTLWPRPGAVCRELLTLLVAIAADASIAMPERAIEAVVMALGRLRLGLASQADVDLVTTALPGLPHHAVEDRTLMSLTSALAFDLLTWELASALPAFAVPDAVLDAVVAHQPLLAAAE